MVPPPGSLSRLCLGVTAGPARAPNPRACRGGVGDPNFRVSLAPGVKTRFTVDLPLQGPAATEPQT